ncbi:MAG: hypothetical protein AAFN16_26365 [Pseudomonadota bacterium]
MAVYHITFRIAKTTTNETLLGASTYQQRYERFLEKLKENKTGGFWSEPTSFVIVETNLDIYTFTKNVTVGLDKQQDLVLVHDPKNGDARYIGIENEAILKSFLPNAVKL